MFSLPQLIEEDVTELNATLGDLIARTEASVALIIDLGGFLIAQQTAQEEFDLVTIGALASASFAATQEIASLVRETNFSSIYQQGETYSLFLSRIDTDCLLVVIFKAHISVGIVKFYSTETTSRAGRQMKKARERAPGQGLDLSALNLADPSPLFRKKTGED